MEESTGHARTQLDAVENNPTVREEGGRCRIKKGQSME